MRLNVTWSADLGALARAYFDAGAATPRRAAPADVLARRHALVVPNRIMQSWLQQYFLYDYRRGDAVRLLAHQDCRLVNMFVNDWLYRMDCPDGRRSAPDHPYAVPNLQWRLYALLDACRGQPGCETLAAYLDAAGEAGAGRDRRRFRLAGRIAKLFDDYQVYRPEMLARWARGDVHDRVPAWQPRLWAALQRENDASYLKAFLQMNDGGLRRCGIERQYDRVAVFGVATMPVVYLAFFHRLARLVPVDFYVFSAGTGDWFESLTPREAAWKQERLRLEGAAPDADDGAGLTGNPLLLSLGSGARRFLGELLDFSDGNVNEIAAGRPAGDSALARLQAQIRSAEPPGPGPAPAPPPADGSIGLQICHSPRRELEVLHDHLLRWFAEDPALQPRQIQVQVPDMAAYAPHIHARFAASRADEPGRIPYVVADGAVAGASPAAAAFLQLFDVADSHFTAPEIVELLHCTNVREAFGLGASALDRILAWINESGIRWGWDARQRDRQAQVACGAATTWRHGLDRLLTGYLFGWAAGAPEAWPPDLPLPCDLAEGEAVDTLGRLARFVDSLATVATRADRLAAALWVRELNDWLDTFFKATNETYADIRHLRDAVAAFAQSIAAAGGLAEPLPRAVVRDFIAGQLDAAARSADLRQNAVLFSALRPGSSVPRRYMCMLGLGDSLFPRSDRRAAYDLLREQPRRGDPSVRLEDRMAFLEALMAARRRLYLSYVGLSDRANEKIPPSTLVTELCEYLGRAGLGHQCCEHRLQAFHPSYFQGRRGDHFSYSAENLAAAKARQAGRPEVGATALPLAAGPFPGPAAEPLTVELDRLIRFLNNPARYYAENTLGIRMDGPAADRLSDSEEFEPEGFTAYQMGTAIIEAMVRQRTPDHTYRELQERGLAPLGRWGRARFEERWREVGEFLARTDPALPDTLLAQLQRQAAQPPAVLDVQAGCHRILGKVENTGERLSAVELRYARTKPGDRLAGWLRHLLVCAATADRPARVCLSRSQRKGALDRTPFAGLAAAEARAHLAGLVDLYAGGGAAVLPFTPEVSFAYAGSRLAERTAGDEDAALAKAEGAWRSGYMSHGADADPYYRLVFGADGPMAHAGFAELALWVFKPLLDAAAGAEVAE